MARKQSGLTGYYLGITGDGVLKTVFWDQGRRTLSTSGPNGADRTFYVEPNRSPSNELVTAFEVYEAEFVTVAMRGSEFEKQIIAKLEKKAAERKK